MIEFHQKTLLRKGLELQKEFYIGELINLEYFKTDEGKQLHELTLTELEQAYKTIKCEKGLSDGQ